jgi:PAS domain S-box-containing protein
MKLLTNYIIKTKIKIISFIAIALIFLMIAVLLWLSINIDSNVQKLEIPTYIHTIIIFLSILLVCFMFFTYLLDKSISHSINSLNAQLEHDIQLKTLELNEKSHYLKQYRYMIDEVESVIQFDIFGNITDVNQHYCNLSKYTKEELIGQSIANFINTNESKSGFFKEITKVITEGSIYKGINSDISKDGEVFTTKTVILPMIPKEDDLIEYFFCIRTNITPLIELTNEIIATQKDVIATMGSIGESRSKETGLHVKRVAEYSRLLALKYGLSKEESDLICFASPMHDIGKVSIRDAILNKPGKLTQEEYEIMKTHPTIGYNMLKNSSREILSAAAIISHEHHEKYDGSGYPNQKKGEDIHLYGRITAIADIFDALGSDRVYKKAWKIEDILTLFQEQKGKHFDPVLINIFIENLDDFLKIRDTFKDEPINTIN